MLSGSGAGCAYTPVVDSPMCPLTLLSGKLREWRKKLGSGEDTEAGLMTLGSTG